MKIGHLTVLERIHSNGTPQSGFVLFSWHHKKSLTWRWALHVDRWVRGEKRGIFYARTYKYRPGWNFQALLNLPLLGRWSLHTQPSVFL